MTFRGRIRSASTRGTVILVALCFVAVMAIVLGSYIAVCTRAMQMSNRSFQAELSRQLAEAGIEEALRAFNKNDWSDWTGSGMTTNWTLDATNKRATATITYPSGKFGQGATAEVKIRVDNYDAAVVGSNWVSSGTYPTYKIGSLVARNGIWYRCVKEHSSTQTPNGISNLKYWAPAPIPWEWFSTETYAQGDVINYQGEWYRYSNATPSIGNVPSTVSSYWTWTRNIYGSYSGSVYYYANDLVYYAPVNTWIMCSSPGWGGGSWIYADISWRWTNTNNFYFNDVVYHGDTWYRCIAATSTGNTPSSSPTYWENALSGAVHGWLSSSINYNLGDVVYYSSTSQWYRCILAHTSSGSITPANTTYWTNTPALSQNWNSDTQYGANDLVRHHGVWYKSNGSNSDSIPSTSSSDWIAAADSTASYFVWNSVTAYTAGTYKIYGGVWYKCLVANTGESPNNTTYWTAAWAQSSGVTTGASIVYAEAIVTLGDGTTSRTQLRAPIAPASLFPNAAGATTTLTIGSSGGTVDSYDNSLGTTYAAQVGTSTNYSAVLASTGTSSPAIAINNTTTVKGYVSAQSDSASPYAPMVSISSGTTVKSASSPASPNTDTSQVSRSPYVPQFTPLPSPSLASAFSAWNFPYGQALPTSGTPATNNTLNLGTPGATTPSRYYYNNGTLNIGSSYYIGTININGPVILYINGTLRIRTGGSLNVNSAGSVELHVDGGIREDASTQGYKNQTSDPKKMLIISDISGTTIHRLLSTTNALYGVIYAPNTTAADGLDIRNGKQIYGALSAREITFTSAANVHYDTSLRHATFSGVDQPYTVTEWCELDSSEQATMP